MSLEGYGRTYAWTLYLHDPPVRYVFGGVHRENACIIAVFSFTVEKLMFALKRDLDSGFHPVGYGLQVLDSTSLTEELGFRIPAALCSIFQSPGFWIPPAKIFQIPDSTIKNFPDSEIRIPLCAWGDDVKGRLHRCHVCTINPLDKWSDVCISELNKINIGVLTSVLTIALWSLTFPDVRAVVIIAVKYAITVTPVNIHKTLRRRAKKNFGALSPYLRKENND